MSCRISSGLRRYALTMRDVKVHNDFSVLNVLKLCLNYAGCKDASKVGADLMMQMLCLNYAGCKEYRCFKQHHVVFMLCLNYAGCKDTDMTQDVVNNTRYALTMRDVKIV